MKIDYELELKIMKELVVVADKYAYLRPAGQERVLGWVKGYWYGAHLQGLYEESRKKDPEKKP